MTKRELLNHLKLSQLGLGSHVEIRVKRHLKSNLLMCGIYLTTKHEKGRLKGSPKQEYLGKLNVEIDI